MALAFLPVVEELCHGLSLTGKRDNNNCVLTTQFAFTNCRSAPLRGKGHNRYCRFWRANLGAPSKEIEPERGPKRRLSTYLMIVKTKVARAAPTPSSPAPASMDWKRRLRGVDGSSTA
jgi:hypothetical protein